MNYNGSYVDFVKMFNQVKRNGMNEYLYKKLAVDISLYVHFPANHVLEILSSFISYGNKPLYVNEIRNYLKEYSPSLFIKYGNRFKNKPGCFEVFGIYQDNMETFDFTENTKTLGTPIKEYDKRSNYNRTDRTTRRNARRESAAKFKEAVAKKKEKDEKNEEIRRLIRKQDL